MSAQNAVRIFVPPSCTLHTPAFRVDGDMDLLDATPPLVVHSFNFSQLLHDFHSIDSSPETESALDLALFNASHAHMAFKMPDIKDRMKDIYARRAFPWFSFSTSTIIALAFVGSILFLCRKRISSLLPSSSSRLHNDTDTQATFSRGRPSVHLTLNTNTTTSTGLNDSEYEPMVSMLPHHSSTIRHPPHHSRSRSHHRSPPSISDSVSLVGKPPHPPPAYPSVPSDNLSVYSNVPGAH